MTHPGEIDEVGCCFSCGLLAADCMCVEEPLPMREEPSGGADLLDELHDALTRYVVFPGIEAAVAVTVWIAATHAQSAWESATRLLIKSPEKRCGKSRLMDVVEAVCHAPLITVNISPAALVRSIGDDPPTLLIDEADTIFGRKAADNHEDLRGIVNAGHQRNRPYIRWDATARAPENCPTFAMAAIAGIGDMPDTIEDRAVVVAMRRRAPGESVKPFRARRDAPRLRELRERLAAWVSTVVDELSEAEPDLPVEDRAADNWEPLVAVADAAGGAWPARVRQACVALTEEAETEASLGIRLLADLRTVFGDSEALHSDTILERLRQIDEAPWSDWYGRQMSPRDLAKLLRPYRVTSKDVKLDGVNRKGYRRDDLYEAWRRYLSPPGGVSATGATDATAQVNGHDQVAGSGYQTLPATEAPPLSRAVAGVAPVAHTPPGGDTTTCVACGQPLDPVLAESGETTHPDCHEEGT